MDTEKVEGVVDCVKEGDDLQITKITRRVQVPDSEGFIRRFSRYTSSGPSGAHFSHSQPSNYVKRISGAPSDVSGRGSPRKQLGPLDPSAEEVIVVRSDRPDPLLASQANKQPQTRIKAGKPNNSLGQPLKAVRPKLRSVSAPRPSREALRRGERANQEPRRSFRAQVADLPQVPRHFGRPRPLHPPRRRTAVRPNRSRRSRTVRPPSSPHFEELAARVREVTYNPPNRQRPTIQLNTAQSIVAHRRHERAQRSIHKKRRIRCPLCPKLVNGQPDLIRHLRATHKAKVGADKSFRCELCMVGCSSQTQLDDHIKGNKHKQLVRETLNDRDRRLLSQIN